MYKKGGHDSNTPESGALKFIRQILLDAKLNFFDESSVGLKCITILTFTANQYRDRYHGKVIAGAPRSEKSSFKQKTGEKCGPDNGHQ